jgi:hypothetical protein
MAVKQLNCHKCLCYLGEIEKGKIKKGSIILCPECFEKYKILEDMGNYNNSTKGSNASMPDMPDFLKGIFQ